MKKLNAVVKTTLYVILLLCTISFVVFLVSSTANKKASESLLSEEVFVENASVEQNEGQVGAKVWMKEAIHKADGTIYYRYYVETDCPNWEFKTKYGTFTPIEWATDDTAAAEVLCYDVQVRYNGAVYAHGQYYTIPVLEDLSSETVSLDEWKESLVKQAYQTYKADAGGPTMLTKASGITMLVLFALFAIGLIVSKPSEKARED